MRRNCFLKHVIEEKKDKIEVTVRQGRIRKQKLDEKRRKRECTGNTNLHYVEKSLWQRLWICHKTEYVMIMMVCYIVTM